MLSAVSFPRFVGELITGVFKAILDTNAQQLQQFIELLNNVAGSASGFAETNYGLTGAASWLVERYPAGYEIEGEAVDPEFVDPEEPARATGRSCSGRAPTCHRPMRCASSSEWSPRSRYRAGTPRRRSCPSSAASWLDTPADARYAHPARHAADRDRWRQDQCLDAIPHRYALRDEADTASQFDMSTRSREREIRRRGMGRSASMQSTIGYVSTQSSQSSEELNTELELNSAVELLFRTDQVPLDGWPARAR